MPCTAQPGFLNITGGARNDFGKSLIRSSKNSFVIAGSSASFTPGNLDAILLSYNNNGGFIWGRTVGGNNDDALNKVVETADGGFIATGYSYSYGNGQECIVVKIDSTGALIWMNTYGGTGDDEGHSIFAMPDQGFLLCGATSSFGSGTQKDGFILRADINGNIIFSKLYGGTGEDYFKDIVLNGTNSIITAGTHQNTSNFDAWILQTDTNGNVLNSNTYGGNGNEEITAIDINQSGFFIGGKTTSYNNGLESGFIALANAGLGLTNTKVYGMASLNYYTSSVVKLYGNGFAFALNANNNVVNNNDGLIVKTDNNLNTQWFKLLGKTKNDAMYSVCNTLEGGVAAVGHTNSFTVGLLDMFFLKADSSGVFNRLNCGPQGNIFEQIVNFSNNAYAVTPRVWPINPSQPNNSTLIVNPITIDFCLPIDAGFIADTVICEGDCIDIVDTSFNATTRYWAFQGATPATSNQVNPSNICYLKGGTFTIRQIVANTYATDTAYLNIRVIPKPKISLGKDTILCKGDTLHIKPNTSILYNFKWQDGSSSKTYSAVDSGKYWLTVSEGACQNADTMVLDFITLLPPFDLADTLICKGEILLLDAKNSSAKHFWFNGDTSKIITVTEPGINFVTSRIGGCSVSDTINVDITELISTGLVADTALCIGETITLNTSGFQNLIWQDGSQNTSYTLADTGTYWVEVLQKCGVRDSIHVRYYQSCACYMQFPSGFTPNNDQLNDGFLPKIECDLKHYTLQIYNRWGEKLFETNDPTAPWLGTNAAKRNCENGLYYFRCIYSGIERDIEKPNVIEGIIGLTR